MLELKNIGLEDRNRLNRFFEAENSRSADYSFGNIYMWDERFLQSVCPVGDRLVTLLHRNGEEYFAFPVGSGDLRPAFDAMAEYCAEKGLAFKICGILEEHRTMIEEAFPHAFDFAEDRDYSDYLYEIEKLALYPGKHLHGKRNFCNRFEAENTWRFEPMTDEHIAPCLTMLRSWEGSHEDSTLIYEHKAILRGFEHMRELGLLGGVLYAGDAIAGFTLGERISDDTFCTHFEKAYAEIPGAYPMVCREMARLVQTQIPQIRYVNREDDMGLPSLRESKLSYKPESILMKYTAVAK